MCHLFGYEIILIKICHLMYIWSEMKIVMIVFWTNGLLLYGSDGNCTCLLSQSLVQYNTLPVMFKLMWHMHYSIVDMMESNLVIGKGVLIWSIINITCFINSHGWKFTFTLMYIATFILKWQKVVCFSVNMNMGFFPCDATDPLLNISHRFKNSQNRYLIKSPRYTGGDFMFLYRFVRRHCRRRCRPQILLHTITFEQLFWFLSFLARLLALTCRLLDSILGNLDLNLDLDFSRSNMEFAISQPKMVRLPPNEKQTYWLNSRAQTWLSGLTLAMTLTFNFQGQIWNLLYLSQKWSDCHKPKSKHIDWTPGLKCDQWVWPWP